MVTKVSGFQADDGTLFDTLEQAIAHEAKHKAKFAVSALVAALGFTGAVVVKDGGSNVDAVSVELFLLENREALIEALSVDVEKPARKPRQPRAPKEEPANTDSGATMTDAVSTMTAAVDSAVTTAAVVAAVTTPAAVVEAVAENSAVDPLDELAASLAGEVEV